MPFDGSGNYTPAGAPNFPAAGGTTILAAYYNNVINDIATALSLCITRDGQGKPTAAIPWNGQDLTGVGNLSCTSLTVTNGIGVASGGTGLSTVPANGKLLIGNGTGYALANLGSSGGISITNGAGSISIGISGAFTASGFTVSTGVLLGRSTTGTGAPEQISIGAGLSLSGGVLSVTGGGSISLATLTFNNGGSGNGSGTGYDGTTAKTISWNTIGAQPITARVQSVASAATVTPTASNDLVRITAQAAALTLANPSGSPTDGQVIFISIKDNGTARTISFGTQYRAVGVTLPTTTVSNKILYIGMVWNAGDSKWDVLTVNQQ